MNDELNMLKRSVDEADEDILKIINNYKTIENWKETKVKALFEFINVVFNTSSVIILEDMLKKGLRLNPIFKSKQNILLKSAIESLNYKVLNLLYIYKIDFTVVDEQDKTVFDHFAYSSSYNHKNNLLDSKRMLKIILKDPQIFKYSLDKGINGVNWLFFDPHLLFRMTLKKFGDLSVLWKNGYIFSYVYNKFRIPYYKYLIESSTELKTNKELKKRILGTLVQKVFRDYKSVIWIKERKNSYSLNCLIFSMIRNSLNS